MVSTFSPNLQLEEPGRGDQVGTWDTPVNANMTLLDLVGGGLTTISGAAGSVALSAAQFQNKTITFNSTLLTSITATFPTSFKKSYEVYNTCTGSSAFTITLQTTVAGGQAVCIPPGEIVDVVNDGTNIRFKNLGRVGEYWDYAGSSVPNWVSGCTVPPYLICNGGTFSSATYPTLALILGSTTLPDQRGRTRYMLDQGVGRVSSAVSGVAGNTIFAGGGDQQTQTHNHSITDPTHQHAQNTGTVMSGAGSPPGLVTGGTGAPIQIGGFLTQAAATGITVNNAGNGAAQNMPPLLVAGITLIRAA
ncbi:hypothetical protein [Bradyrhizobium sp. SZCCHNR1098]|uniref:phage tail protein n=1 Tax=Bradyrhizobium sp. SZCCHNR1098 TaxID=3057370 RepID=UPI002916E4E6|nr:hypothetical protein [Bradyrhizobium sp. SZCCHNR1098]